MSAGEQVIPLDAIVGTVDRRRGDFDRSFRPSPNTRGRWERIAEARKRGEAMPPIDVFRIGDLYFVQDGHHRVSVARAMGDKDINANVVEVRTKLGADRELQMSDLPLKAPRARLPRARPAAAGDARADPALRRVALRAARDADRVLGLPRLARARARAAAARAGAAVVRGGVRADGRRCCARPGIGGGGTETERYLRVAMLRFLLLQRHDWTDELAERLAGEVKSPEHRPRRRTR